MSRFAFFLLISTVLAPITLSGFGFADFKPVDRGSGKKISVYAYFRKLASQGGGIVAVSTALHLGSSRFFLPEVYPKDKYFDYIVEKFCALFPIFQFRFSGNILNIYSGERSRQVLGNGKQLPPDQWFSSAGKLAGISIEVLWEPAAGHTRKNFRIPLYWLKGRDAAESAEKFCAFFTDYDFRIRGEKLYLFPKGDWAAVAKKYREPLIVAPTSGISLMVGVGAVVQVGYTIRLSRFFIEPRLGIADVKFKASDRGFTAVPSLLFSWCALYMENIRWYLGATIAYSHNFRNGEGEVPFGFLTGVEYGGVFMEFLVAFENGGVVPRAGAGWRF